MCSATVINMHLNQFEIVTSLVMFSEIEELYLLRWDPAINKYIKYIILCAFVLL